MDINMLLPKDVLHTFLPFQQKSIRGAGYKYRTNNIILIAGFVVSFQLLLAAKETIPLATAYAV
ncbi:SMR family transporter [Paenibacillus nanensis]|uniref:SMR family transporter n=1 Tax=Paenibacillus nanensis TaxID=393251 RepID=UPI001F0CC845|nr:SMR family transporter [Paenibacillus nanensis]